MATTDITIPIHITLWEDQVKYFHDKKKISVFFQNIVEEYVEYEEEKKLRDEIRKSTHIQDLSKKLSKRLSWK